MTDWRALCQELADALDHNRQCLLDDRRLTHPLAAEARAALAQPEHEVVGPTDQELADAFAEGCRDGSKAGEPPFLGGARAVLARYGRQPAPPAEGEQRHPTPVPVSRRLPGPGDCDEEGLCWWFSPADPSAGTFGVAACWVLRKYEPEDDFRTHWLPATALPLPSGEVEA